MISLINSAVDTILKSAGFSQLLSKQSLWQHGRPPLFRGCPPGCLLAHISCMTQICHLKTCWPCLVLVERLGFLHSSPVSDYPLCLWGNAFTLADNPFLGVLVGCNCLRTSWIWLDHGVKERELVYLVFVKGILKMCSSNIDEVYIKRKQQNQTIVCWRWSSRLLFKKCIHLFAPHPQTMAKVITSILKFPPDQAQKVLDKEDTKPIVSIGLPA